MLRGDVRRFRYIAVHEAAHVVAFCRLGDGIVAAYLEPGREGGETFHHVMGATTEYLLCTLAGSFAEARYRRKSPALCGLDGGQVDFDTARAIAAVIEPNEAQRVALMLRAERDVRAFLNKPNVWQQIEAVADVLQRDGHIYCQQAADICAR